MKRTLLAIIVPPAAVIDHGYAASTAAPIGVFWVCSLASLIYGLSAASGASIIIGTLLWMIATSWAWLVLRGVENDLLGREGSTRMNLAAPHDLDESDPFSQLRASS